MKSMIHGLKGLICLAALAAIGNAAAAQTG
jgi:hypothetical protein